MYRTWGAGRGQGQHIVIIGPTGRGKTFLAHQLLPLQAWSFVVAVKRKDDTLEEFRADPRYTIINAWPPPYDAHHVVLWVKPEQLGFAGEQRRIVYDAMNHLYLEGGWAVLLDDANYLTAALGLRHYIVEFMNMGRSSGLSCIVSCQRPRYVPLEAFTQVRYVLAFRMQDRKEMQRTAEIAGVNYADYELLNRKLGPHDFICAYEGAPVIVRA